jgi:hypothetical protein
VAKNSENESIEGHLLQFIENYLRKSNQSMSCKNLLAFLDFQKKSLWYSNKEQHCSFFLLIDLLEYINQRIVDLFSIEVCYIQNSIFI